MLKLQAADLRKSYRGRKVVDDVNLEIQQGEVVGLLGPNGAGKTTTFYILVGLARPDYGRVMLDGEDITDLPMYLRARSGISYLPQEPSVFRKLTVEENLLAVLETLSVTPEQRRDRVEELLAQMGLEGVRYSQAHVLSGGERRRLEIARSLVLSPSFVLLDEPFAGIDPLTVVDIQKIIARSQRRGHRRPDDRPQCSRYARSDQSRLYHQRRENSGRRNSCGACRRSGSPAHLSGRGFQAELKTMNWLAPKLHLRLAQKQILTPGLVQMVSVLALNRLELREMINQEIMANPVLEELAEDGVTARQLHRRSLPEERNRKSSRNSGRQSLRRIRFWLLLLAVSRHGRRTRRGRRARRNREALVRQVPFFAGEPHRSPGLATERKHLQRNGPQNRRSDHWQPRRERLLDRHARRNRAIRRTIRWKTWKKRLPMVQEFDPPGVAARNLEECLHPAGETA